MSNLPFYFGEWIDLHSGEYFASVIAYLRGLLDREAVALATDPAFTARDNPEIREVQECFAKALSLEVAFWNYAWGTPA